MFNFIISIVCVVLLVAVVIMAIELRSAIRVIKNTAAAMSGVNRDEAPIIELSATNPIVSRPEVMSVMGDEEADWSELDAALDAMPRVEVAPVDDKKTPAPIETPQPEKVEDVKPAAVDVELPARPAKPDYTGMSDEEKAVARKQYQKAYDKWYNECAKIKKNAGKGAVAKPEPVKADPVAAPVEEVTYTISYDENNRPIKPDYTGMDDATKVAVRKAYQRAYDKWYNSKNKQTAAPKAQPKKETPAPVEKPAAQPAQKGSMKMMQEALHEIKTACDNKRLLEIKALYAPVMGWKNVAKAWDEAHLALEAIAVEAIKNKAKGSKKNATPATAQKSKMETTIENLKKAEENVIPEENRISEEDRNYMRNNAQGIATTMANAHLSTVVFEDGITVSNGKISNTILAIHYDGETGIVKFDTDKTKNIPLTKAIEGAKDNRVMNLGLLRTIAKQINEAAAKKNIKKNSKRA